MPFFKCDTTKITTQQLAAISAAESLFLEQNMALTVTSLDPITVNLKATLNETMIKRLFVDRVPIAIQGYIGKAEGGNLVIQKAETDKPTPKRGRRASKSDSNI